MQLAGAVGEEHAEMQPAHLRKHGTHTRTRLHGQRGLHRTPIIPSFLLPPLSARRSRLEQLHGGASRARSSSPRPVRMRDLVSTHRQQARAERQNSCPCLNDGEVFFAGFSELRHIVDAVLEGLTCTDEDAGMYENHVLCSTNKRLITHFGSRWTGLARGHRGMRDSLCREAVYSQRPYGARCQGAGYDLRLRYEWKSFQASARDVVHRKRVLAAAARGGRVLVVLSGGLHDMTSFRAITEQQRKAMPASMRWPQEGWLGLALILTPSLILTLTLNPNQVAAGVDQPLRQRHHRAV